ncbi:MAG: Rieske 2Fe-2S domain-containing protein [Phycisphaerales bacterium]|nr:Rieske 2Fe-2S domain-containing protein [Phycisphaerales bacterium]
MTVSSAWQKEIFSAIQPDEGKIVSADGQRLAVYRDEKGRLQAVSPVCTHLGCMVEWNNAEKHWDCKCHGSLFKPDGEPFAGPASEPLERKIVDEEEAPDESSRSQAAAQSRAGGRSS